jgi:hypothetical protein
LLVQLEGRCRVEQFARPVRQTRDQQLWQATQELRARLARREYDGYMLGTLSEPLRAVNDAKHR